MQTSNPLSPENLAVLEAAAANAPEAPGAPEVVETTTIHQTEIKHTEKTDVPPSIPVAAAKSNDPGFDQFVRENTGPVESRPSFKKLEERNNKRQGFIQALFAPFVIAASLMGFMFRRHGGGMLIGLGVAVVAIIATIAMIGTTTSTSARVHTKLDAGMFQRWSFDGDRSKVTTVKKDWLNDRASVTTRGQDGQTYTLDQRSNVWRKD